MPAGTQFVQARVTWPSGPNVSLQTAVYDSNGNFVSYGETGGGYGHLSFAQISLLGPGRATPGGAQGRAVGDRHLSTQRHGADRRPDRAPADRLPAQGHGDVGHAVETDRHDQTRSRRAHQGDGHRSQAAGTSFSGIAVSNGASTTTIPVAVRVPVTLTDGHGTFGGTITGSTVEYSGGEFYFYDVKVPAGTASISASLHWPDTGNLVDLYLIDPNGDLRDAKGGDLLWYPDYSSADPQLVPDAAFDHTAEQVIWDAPQAGTWQVMVWAAGFNGDSFSEPYSGSIVLDTPVVAPASWTATAPAGGTASADFTVTNAGTTALPAYAESQATSDGTALYDDVALDPVTGTLTGTLDGISPILTFTLPQNATLVTARATWTSSDPSTLVDLGLYDPSQTDKAESLATTNLGNAAVVVNPMAGLWTLILGYGNPALPPADANYTVNVDYVAPTAIPGFTASGTFDAPVEVAPGDSGTIHVSIDVPADAQPGDVITGTLHFSTVGDGTEAEGGDHLGSVPVTITVGAI